MDNLSQIFQIISFLFSLVILALLWRRAFRSSEIHRFPRHLHDLPSKSGQVWILLAAAWTLGMLGTIAWIVHDLVTGTELNEFSIVDVFYISRYTLLGCVLWLYPAPLPRRDGFWICGALLAGVVIAQLIYFKPITALLGGTWLGFLGQVMYLILDVGIIVLAWLRFRAPRPASWDRYVLLLVCAMLSYGTANTINLTEYVFSLKVGTLQNVLWTLTDVLMLILALSGLQKMRNEE
ncbi:MAG TPA: hypothetical protein VHP14_23130 [Anaerolineales bacterium]|nr:hypothetical protein [Anaerolineales bacterium]